MYPTGAPPDRELEAAWTWDFFSQAAEKCLSLSIPASGPVHSVITITESVADVD